MAKTDLDIQFEKAVAIANTMTQSSLPQDLQLQLYASYKQATQDIVQPNVVQEFDIRSAFKINALMQIRHLSQDEAKELYISLINQIHNAKK